MLVMLNSSAAREVSVQTNGIARSYNVIPAWHCHAKVLCKVSIVLGGRGIWGPTTVMGIIGAFGNMNLTSSNFCRLLQFSASDTHPAPLSPRP